MEELIVLGQVPLLHFQITFWWFQCILIGLFSFTAYRYWKHRQTRHEAAQQRHFDVISLRSLDQA